MVNTVDEIAYIYTFPAPPFLYRIETPDNLPMAIKGNGNVYYEKK